MNHYKWQDGDEKEGKRDMPAFQVSSRIMQPPGPTKKRISHARKAWYAVIQVVCGVLIVVALTFLSRTAGLSLWFFLLLPVGVSLITARSHLYNRKVLLLTGCLALI